jgi:hypothetical protein
MTTYTLETHHTDFKINENEMKKIDHKHEKR